MTRPREFHYKIRPVITPWKVLKRARSWLDNRLSWKSIFFDDSKLMWEWMSLYSPISAAFYLQMHCGIEMLFYYAGQQTWRPSHWCVIVYDNGALGFWQVNRLSGWIDSVVIRKGAIKYKIPRADVYTATTYCGVFLNVFRVSLKTRAVTYLSGSFGFLWNLDIHWHKSSTITDL